MAFTRHIYTVGGGATGPVVSPATYNTYADITTLPAAGTSTGDIATITLEVVNGKNYTTTYVWTGTAWLKIAQQEITLITSANTFVPGNIVRQSAAGSYVLAEADANANVGGYAICYATATEFMLATYGTVIPIVGEGALTFAAGDSLYLSQIQAGAVTNVQPATGEVVPVGKALSATEMDYSGFIGLNVT